MSARKSTGSSRSRAVAGKETESKVGREKRMQKKCHIGEIVFSHSFFDIGVCTEVDSEGKPTHVRATSYQGDEREYGGVSHIFWIPTGVYTTEDEWQNKAVSGKSANEIANTYGISISKLKKQLQEKEKVSEPKVEQKETAIKVTRDELISALSSYFQIGTGDCDAYFLMRDKSGFAVGTVTVDDFQEFDEENMADIADYIYKKFRSEK